MKIAICLSGQPRSVEVTARGIINHFSENHEYDFFCHSWNENTWKQKKDQMNWTLPEKVDEEVLSKQLQIFNPKYIKISDESELGKNRAVPWSSLFYSMMYSIYLKKKYEIENNFRYDLVVKCRYDLAFDPEIKFNTWESTHPLDINASYSDRMPRVYQRTNVSDVMFFGNSHAMDVMGDIYWYIMQRKRMLPDDYESVDPGILMYKYAADKNLVFKFNQHIRETIYRREMMPLDPMKFFKEINDTHLGYYSYHA